MRQLSCAMLLWLAGLMPAMSQDKPLGFVTADDFVAMHQELATCPNEPWRSIPWKTSVLDAQRTAAVEGKPIFIWAMDGHPLGCT